jgi:hypothetical protein
MESQLYYKQIYVQNAHKILFLQCAKMSVIIPHGNSRAKRNNACTYFGYVLFNMRYC